MTVAMVLGIALPLAWQWLDKRRMTEDMRAKTWNVATWGASLYAFGPLSMLGWYWVTRPRWRRVLLGASSATVLLLLLELGDAALRAGLGEPGDDGGLLQSAAVAQLGLLLLLTVFELVSLARARLRGRR